MKRLIVTADDFGIALPVNEAVERAHREGIVNTTSLMVGEAAADDAVRRAQLLPHLRVGLHVVVTRGHAVSPRAEIPDLTNADGRFSSQLVRTGFKYFFRPGIRAQLEREVRAQFERFHQTGLPLDHVNAHNHYHLHPTVLGVIARVARDYGSPPVRVPLEPFWASWRAARTHPFARFAGRVGLWPWLTLMRLRLRMANLAFNDYIFGLNDTGHMDEPLVLRLLARVPDGVSEMHFHPATSSWPDMDPEAVGSAFEGELAALTSSGVADAMKAHAIQPYTFSELRARNA